MREFDVLVIGGEPALRECIRTCRMLSPEARLGAIRADKVMQMSIVTGRNFKRQGMNWTKEGANNLDKLRTVWHNKTNWEGFWKRQNLARVSFSPIILASGSN